MRFSTHFKSYLQAECGLAENTLKAYLSDILSFCTTCDSPEFEHTDVTTWLRAHPASPATGRRRIASIRAYVRFLVLNGLRKSSAERLLANLDLPKKDRPLPNVLNKSQVVELLSRVAPGENYLRDMAVLELLYGSGLRASELTTLDRENLGLELGVVRVMGKGSKERLVPVGKAAREALANFLGDRMTGRVFPGLDRFKLATIVKRARASAGIQQKVSTHTLRHCFASHMLQGHDPIEMLGGRLTVNTTEGKADIRHIQEMMGHSDIKTTAVYLHLDVRYLKKIHALLGR